MIMFEYQVHIADWFAFFDSVCRIHHLSQFSEESNVLVFSLVDILYVVQVVIYFYHGDLCLSIASQVIM